MSVFLRVSNKNLLGITANYVQIGYFSAEPVSIRLHKRFFNGFNVTGPKKCPTLVQVPFEESQGTEVTL